MSCIVPFYVAICIFACDDLYFYQVRICVCVLELWVCLWCVSEIVGGRWWIMYPSNSAWPHSWTEKGGRLREVPCKEKLCWWGIAWIAITPPLALSQPGTLWHLHWPRLGITFSHLECNYYARNWHVQTAVRIWSTSLFIRNGSKSKLQVLANLKSEKIITLVKTMPAHSSTFD